MGGPNIQKGKQVLGDLFPSFILSPTAIHIIGSVEGPDKSRCLYQHVVDSEYKEAEVMDSWTTLARRTFLWQYVYDQVKDFAQLPHEVVIITDGVDNDSDSCFRGLMGFNEFMRRMDRSKIRISLFLIGSRLSSKDATTYRDLCLATGGLYHHSKDGPFNEALAVEEFIAPLLLTRAERDKMARFQQHQYLSLLRDRQATTFEWFRPLANAPFDDVDHSGVRGSSCLSEAAGKPNRLHLKPTQRISAYGANFSVTEVM